MTWKESFDRISTELGMADRKKQALENLHSGGRVSQFAFECLNKELAEETAEIETRRKALVEKMTGKLNELEEQRMALELFLANTEMAYAAGEISDEIHAKESSALDSGLEATKQELGWIKEAIVQLVPKEDETPAPTATPTESTEVAAAEPPAEEASEENQTAQVEVPEVTVQVTEAKAEEIQPPEETPTETPAITGEEPGEDSFRQPSEETPKQS